MAIESRRYPVAPGLSVAADVGGDPAAPAVVLQHGVGQTRRSWERALQELLAAGYHVVNLDARGHGASDWDPRADYTLEAYAADLAAVVATLASPPVVVGASMGGATALCAVAEQGVALGGLVLVDVVPRVDTAAADRIRAFMLASPDGFATVEEAAEAVAAFNPHRPRPASPAGLLKNLRRRPDGRLAWHWDPNVLRQPWRTDRERSTDRLLEAARRITIPTLLVRGLASDIVSSGGVEEFRAHLRGLEVCDVTDAGHMVVGDRNDAFNRCVVDFLKRRLPVA